MDRLLWLLPVLACPIAMGAMMLFMMKPGRKAPPNGRPDPREQEIAQLRAEINEMRRHERDIGTDPR